MSEETCDAVRRRFLLDYMKQRLEVMVHKDKDLVKHGSNMPGYLQYGEKIADKAFSFGVLDWSRLENWKSNTKPRVMKTSNNPTLESGWARLYTSINNSIPQSGQQAEQMIPSEKETSFPDTSHEHRLSEYKKSRDNNLKGVNERRLSDDDFHPLNSSPFLENKSSLENLTNGEDCMKFDPDIRHSSLSRRFGFSLEKMAKSFSFKTSSKKANATNIITSIPMTRLLKSSNLQALLQLTMKNGIPVFKLTVDRSSNNILAATVKKLPSGKDDSSLIYTFYSVHEIKKKTKDCGFGYNIVGHMKISSSYHAEFSGLERDLFVVRESVLYGPDFLQSNQITELCAIIVKNTSKENYGGIGGSKSAVVILPGSSHSLPNSGQPSSLINRWRSGGVCDCGGWDIGCELGVLTNHNETIEVSNPPNSDRLDLCYQGKHDNEHAFRLASLENGLYSLEYNASASLLQAFSICVAIVSSQNLTHIFQVNHLQDVNDFTNPTMARHQKVKSQTIVYAKIPPVSPIGRV